MATSVLGNMGGESFAENISGKVLVKSETITARYITRYHGAFQFPANYISIKGSGIASVKFVYTSTQEDDYTNIGSLFLIKVDGVTLHDYTHFKDYRRGYVFKGDNFDFLTIPFSKSIEIGFLNDYELCTNTIVGDIASVVVWQDED